MKISAIGKRRFNQLICTNLATPSEFSWNQPEPRNSNSPRIFWTDLVFIHAFVYIDHVYNQAQPNDGFSTNGRTHDEMRCRIVSWLSDMSDSETLLMRWTKYKSRRFRHLAQFSWRCKVVQVTQLHSSQTIFTKQKQFPNSSSVVSFPEEELFEGMCRWQILFDLWWILLGEGGSKCILLQWFTTKSSWNPRRLTSKREFVSNWCTSKSEHNQFHLKH